MLNKNKKELLDLFRKKCRQHNLSMTPQRLAIYTEMIDSTDHPSAENIFNRVREAFPDIAVDTIYRTLTTFSEIGVIHVVEGYGEVKRYDPDTEPHHHFRCTRCNRIVDLHGDTFGKLSIPLRLKKKYNVSNIKVVLEGACDCCLKNR